MGNSTSTQKISSQDRAILDMKTQRDKLHQYQKRVTVITDRETAIARECLARGDKPKALLALRRKKFQESLLAKTDAQLATLEQLTSNIEFALVQKDVVFGLQQGANVLKQIHAEMGGIENVEKMLGESEEARQYQEEISQMLAAHMTRGDEEEVEEELEKLELQEQGLKQGAEVVEESVPTQEYPIAPANEPAEANRVQEAARKQASTKERKTAQSAEQLLAA